MDTNNITISYIQYARKSSEAKEKQALSIQEQNYECDKYLINNPVNVVLKLEESKSAFKPHNRPEFDKMVEMIQSGQANAILTWKPDRLSRNPEEGGKILQMLQDGLLQEIRTVTGDVYTQNSDHLILQIHFGMANQYSRNLSQNVKRGMKYKCERGQYPRPALLGYEGYGDRGNRNIKPHPIEAPIIKDLFNMAKSSLFPLSYLTKYAFEKGLRTKSGKKISKNHMYIILTCPTYYGYFRYQGELYQGNYEPLITKTLFDQVQETLHNRNRPKSHAKDHPFRGFIKCGLCGCAIKTTVKNKYYPKTDNHATYIYYSCTHNRMDCKQMPITEQELNQMLVDEISKIAIDKEVWELGLNILKTKHHEQVEINVKQLQKLQQGIQDQRLKLSNLIDMRASGELSKEEFLSQKELVLKEQLRLNNLIKDNEDSANNWINQTQNFINTAYYAKEIINGKDVKKKEDLLLEVAENLYLKDKKLYITIRKPYDILLDPAYRTNGLPDLDSNQEPIA